MHELSMLCRVSSTEGEFLLITANDIVEFVTILLCARSKV